MASLRNRLSAALGGLPATFWTLFAGMLVNRLASFVAIFLALYLVRERGLSPGEAGRIVSLFGVGVLVAGPLGGTLADAIGRRATMLLSLGLGALAVGAIGFLRAPWLLGLFAFLAALTSELYRPAMNAAIADLVPPADRVRAYGLVYWAVNLGWSISLAFAGLVAERSFVLLFLADATTCLVFAAIVFLRVPETRPAGTHAHAPLAGLSIALRDGPLVVFLLLHLLGLVVFLQFQLAAPLDMAAHDIGPKVFSALMALNGFGVVVLQPLLGPALQRRDGAHLLALSALLFGLGFGVNAAVGTALGDALGPLTVYGAGVLLWTVGEVVGFPAANALVANLAPVPLRGRYQGAFSMAWGVAFALSPLLGGEVLTRLGARALWLFCLALGVAVAGAHLAVAGPRRRRLAALRSSAPPPT
ncbi:MFS transporter [Anaeromyxobacter terrae]|uniref:MFS transporter n=1 Tax=Anaeromyxobacter terrae TaxID=2925406 RepID=UPI001F56B3DD|nr:MFS transporter [Anaeromyxobacter sp. SG22]